MKTALEVLKYYTGLSVTEPDMIRMQTQISFVEMAMKQYAIQALEEASERAKGYIKGHGVKINKESILEIKNELR